MVPSEVPKHVMRSVVHHSAHGTAPAEVTCINYHQTFIFGVVTMESGPHQTHCLNVLVRQELIFSLDVVILKMTVGKSSRMQ